MDKIVEIEKTVNREKLIYRANEYTYSFKHFQTSKTFGRDICNGEITLKEADNDQTNLLVETIPFKTTQNHKIIIKKKIENRRKKESS